MSLRCGCPDQGDDIVFGPAHECTVDPSVRVKRLGWFEANSIITALASARAVSQQDFALSPEPRYMETLDELERRGD